MARVGAAVCRDAVDDQLVGEGRDVGTPDARDRGHDPDQTQAAAERDDAPVPGATSRGQLTVDVRLAGKVLAQPRLAFRQERHRPALVLGSDRPRRDRHDDAPIRMDDHAHDARPRRAPQRVRERPARQVGDGGGLPRHERMMPSREPLAERPTRCPCEVDGRGRPPRPARAGPDATIRAPWGYSSAGRAPAWHAGGPGFESP